MPAASDVTRLLDDIEARQQSVIEELDALLARIEAVIAEYTPAKQADPAATTAPLAEVPSEAVEPDLEDETQGDPDARCVDDADRDDSDGVNSDATAKPRRRKAA